MKKLWKKIVEIIKGFAGTHKTGETPPDKGLSGKGILVFHHTSHERIDVDKGNLE